MHLSPWRRRTAAAAAAAVASVGLLIPTAAADPVTDDPDLLLHYDFASPGVVADVSGNGNDGTLLGAGATIADGELRLPGGGAGSGAGHVRLPDGLFDGRDTLTISTWLKNETGDGNYAAAFFGSPGNPPAQYWLLNPSTPSGTVKTVLTGSSAPSAPWGTEVGISPTNGAQGVAGPRSTTEWAMYTTVITPTSITGYLNGTSMGTVPVARTVSQFGTGLVGYLGRSSYPDNYFRGGIDDVVVSAGAYDAADVANLYHSGDRVPEATTQAALAADADAVVLPVSTSGDVTLPSAGASGAAIAWASDDVAHLAADGTVTRPGQGQPDVEVTLTATLTLGGSTLTRTYDVTVLALDPAGDLDRTADAFDLGVTVTADDITLLPQSRDGAADIAWGTSDAGVIGLDGTVTRGGSDREVTLTATFTAASAPGASAVRTYRVTVPAQDAGRIAAYIRTGDTDRTDVLHLAAATGSDGAYVALNNDKGVRYPTFGRGSSRYGSPVIFRQPDGTFGFLATDNGTSAQVFVYDSADLVTYGNERLATTNTAGHVVSRASVRWDNAILAYRVVYTTPAGASYEVTTADFASFSAPVSTTTPAASAVAGLPGDAVEASELAVTRDVYDAVVAKLGRITNTGVGGFADVTLPVDGDLALPEKVDLTYSDGSTKQLGVEWDTSDVDLTAPGTYEVTGEVQQPVYGDTDGILVRERADPWVLRDDERTGETEYYLTGSYPTTQENAGVGYDRIVLRRAGDINGLTSAQEKVVLYAGNVSPSVTKEPGVQTATSHFRYFWAPEFHKIDGDWVILFTASTGTGSPWDIRPAIMRADGEDDPLDPASWSEPQFMQAFPGDTAAFTHFSLDMTYFEANGKHYMVWAEKPGSSDLRMAEIDPADPQRLTSPSILLSTPNYAWERSSGNVINEGASVISDDRSVFVFFSAASVDETYAVGVLSAPKDGDLMDPATWTKSGYPLLTTDDFDGAQMGPGHNSFTLDADGNPVIVYHARPPRAEWAPGADGGLNDPSRHARVKTVHFAADGQAVLNQTREEELASENREVSLTVTVEAEPVEPVVPVFADVPAGTQFFEQIQWLAQRQISTGWQLPDGTKEYRPVTPVARDAMAAFLYRLAGSPAFTAPEVSPFTDVDVSNKFYKEITWLHTTGISTGWPQTDGTAQFRPLDPIARDAMAAFLHRYADQRDGIQTDWTPPAVSPFSDVDVSNQYYEEITWLHTSEIATGWTGAGNDGTDIYQPLSPVNRDAMAAFMNRLENHLTQS
ncbi:family 43 glycosylhydrolase [Serinibacter arcticus]|uniref:family 43 glycosylhydrolase n=1 Tax=Serinibacter arcticus TaxID=1655435 RepID=UPI0013050848|nr:family 43 glycosylhydrolase [Serinibacter arcticus]